MEERLKTLHTPGWSTDSLPCPVLAGCLPQSLPRAGSFRAKCRSEQIERLCNWLWPQKRESVPRAFSVGLFLPLLNSSASSAFLGATNTSSHLLAASGARGLISLLHIPSLLPPSHLRARPQALCPEDRSGSSPSFSAQSQRPQFLIQGKVPPLVRTQGSNKR